MFDNVKDKIESGNAKIVDLGQGYYAFSELRSIMNQQGQSEIQPNVTSFKKSDLLILKEGHQLEIDGIEYILEIFK